jgi:hypothetical protein
MSSTSLSLPFLLLPPPPPPPPQVPRLDQQKMVCVNLFFGILFHDIFSATRLENVDDMVQSE